LGAVGLLNRGLENTVECFPEIPFADWKDTLVTVHRFAQIVGKIRLAASPRRNHWWNVPFHVTGRGITTRPMTDGAMIFTIDFDFLDHRLDITALSGERYSFPLAGQSVASFYHHVRSGLSTVGVEVTIAQPWPFDLSDSGRPFAQDTEHASYDPVAVNRYWQVLSQVNLLLETFAAGYSGKTSPVHHFWHTFDIAVTRFGDTSVEHSAATDPVTREAYSRDVISFGFWFGDDTFPEPAFYSYTAPEPTGLADEPLWPSAARWIERNASHLAVLRYDDVRALPEPGAAVLDFYDSAYHAGARHAGWDIARWACPGGVTDPYLMRTAHQLSVQPGSGALGE
jgi:Family of unknown function (DUF5996)